MQFAVIKKNRSFLLYFVFPFLFFIAITAVFFGKSLFPPSDKIIQGWDIHFQWYFLKSYLADSLKHGRIPFWNPYVLGGTPFIAHPLSAFFSPFNLLFVVFPVNRALSLFLASHIFIAGFSMYLFLRKKLGLVSSLFAGTAYSLSGAFAVRISAGHIDYVAGMAWIPAVFGTTVLLFETGKKRYFLLLIFSLNLQILTGMSFIVFLTIILVLFFLISVNFQAFFHKKRKVSFKNTFLVFLSIALAFFLSAISLLPTLEMTGLSVRQHGLSIASLNEGSYNFSDFRLFYNPMLYGFPAEQGGSGYNGPAPNFYDRTYFFGIIPLALFLIYLGTSLYRLVKQKKTYPLFSFILISTAFFLLMSLGQNTPLFEKITALPVFKLYRIPPRYLLAVSFLLALSSGYVLSLVRKKPVKLAVFAVLLLELISFDRKFMVLTHLPEHYINSDLVGFFKQNLEDKRVLNLASLWSSFQLSYPYNTGYLSKIPSTNGYDPFILKDYFRFVDIVINRSSQSSVENNMMVIPLINFESPNANMLSYKYLLSEGPLATPENKWRENLKEIKSAPSYKIYENTKPWEKYFLVSGIKTYTESSVSLLNNPIENIDFSKTAVIEIKSNKDLNFATNCKENSLKEIKVLSENEESADLWVNTDCNSLLVSSNVYYPGWTAKIDGKNVPLYKTNLAFQGVYIPKGSHRVKLYYRPVIFYIGTVISLSAILSIFIILKFWKKEGKNEFL